MKIFKNDAISISPPLQLIFIQRFFIFLFVWNLFSEVKSAASQHKIVYSFSFRVTKEVITYHFSCRRPNLFNNYFMTLYYGLATPVYQISANSFLTSLLTVWQSLFLIILIAEWDTKVSWDRKRLRKTEWERKLE